MSGARRAAGQTWDASDLPAAGVEQPNVPVGEGPAMLAPAGTVSVWVCRCGLNAHALCYGVVSLPTIMFWCGFNARDHVMVWFSMPMIL